MGEASVDRRGSEKQKIKSKRRSSSSSSSSRKKKAKSSRKHDRSRSRDKEAKATREKSPSTSKQQDPPQQPESVNSIAPHTRVTLHGLQMNIELNGLTGKVLPPSSSDVPGTVKVLLDSGREVAARPQNIIAVGNSE